MLLSALFRKSEPVGERLRNLNRHLPGWPSYLYDFANYVASRPAMRGNVTPVEFVLESKASAYDLSRGWDKYRGKIDHKLVGCNSAALIGVISVIGTTVFFAKRLRKRVESLTA